MKKLVKKNLKKNITIVKLYENEAAGSGCTNGTCQGAGNNCNNKSAC